MFIYFLLFYRGYALLVVKIDSLTSLGLRSLQKINDGGVYIKGNKNLCYHDIINWMRILNSTAQKRPRKHIDISGNRPTEECGEWGVDHLNFARCDGK